MQCIADLYSGFEIADAPVIGIKTLGENMADSGGTKIAHQALLEWYEETTGQKTSLAGERLFFVSFAQLWCEGLRSLPGNLRLHPKGTAANLQGQAGVQV